MKTLNCLVSVLVCLAGMVMAPARSSADLIGYAVAQPNNGGIGPEDQLFSVDLTTHTATLLGSTQTSPSNYVDIDSLALSSNGTLYAADGSGILYTLDKTNGAATEVGNTGLGAVRGMHFLGGTLLGMNTNNPTTIYSLDTSTANPTAFISFAQGPARALTFSDGNTALVPSDTPTAPSLVAVNLTTGGTTVLGTINTLSNSLAAMDFDGSLTTLYGLDNLGNEYTINPLNGNATLLGNTGGSYFYTDLAIAPFQQSTPEPATLALLASGLAAVGGCRILRARRGPSSC